MGRHKLDHVVFGILIAVIVAALGSIMIGGIEQMLAESGTIDSSTSSISGRRSRTTYLLAICLNIIAINYFKKMYWMEAQRGVVVGTFGLAMFWLYTFYSVIFA